MSQVRATEDKALQEWTRKLTSAAGRSAAAKIDRVLELARRVDQRGGLVADLAGELDRMDRNVSEEAEAIAEFLALAKLRGMADTADRLEGVAGG
jgi:hypothetical protein